MSLPNAPLIRIIHPALPGVVFDVAHTEAQADAKTRALLLQHPGFGQELNEPVAPTVAAAEAPAPDTLTLWLEEVVHLAGSRDDAYKFLAERLAIAENHLQDVRIAEAALRGEEEAATPARPPVCPFEQGNLITDQHSGTQAAVLSVDDTAGEMIVLLTDRTPHTVPAQNYADFELVDKATPKGFFVDRPAPEVAPVDVAAATPPRVKSTKPKAAKRKAADLLKHGNN